MMRSLSVTALCALSALLYAQAALAYGVGGHATVHYGRYAWVIDESFRLKDAAVCITGKPGSFNALTSGGGFLWETCPAGVALFGFRQSAGYEAFISDRMRLGMAVLTNTFGFRLFRNDRFRLWAGPHLNLHCRWGGDRRRSWYLLLPGGVPVTFMREYLLFTIGIGGSLGINVTLTDPVILSLEGGIQAGVTASARTRDMGPSFAYARWIDGFISAGVICRIAAPERRKAGIEIIE